MRRREFVGTSAAVVAVLCASVASRKQARADSTKVHRVGLLAAGGLAAGSNPAQLAEYLADYLKQDGFVSGANLEILKRGASGRAELLPKLLAELVRSNVDLLLAFGYPVAAAAKEAAIDIPVVIFNAGDPVKMRLVDSLNRPGGNITGISDVAGELAPKRLELLKQAAPNLHRVAMLWNAGDLGMTSRYEASAAAAAGLNITVQALGVREPNDFDEAFAAMERAMPDGLLMVADTLTALNRRRVFEFATAHRLPAIYEAENFVRDGGLMSYGPDITETAERGASLVARILRGSKPSELPLEQPTRFRLAINLKTARALGFTFPLTLLASADEVIE